MNQIDYSLLASQTEWRLLLLLALTLATAAALIGYGAVGVLRHRAQNRTLLSD